jgi:Protein of unknown function (DUF1186)
VLTKAVVTDSRKKIVHGGLRSVCPRAELSEITRTKIWRLGENTDPRPTHSCSANAYVLYSIVWMRLIDILNGLHFAGADYIPALEAAYKRKNILVPILHRVLSYAASQPKAYECRFSASLLDASAFLLAEWGYSKFLSLARPLLSPGDHPNLCGCYPEDSARLIARAAHSNSRDIIDCLLKEHCTETFAVALLEATVYVAAWHPECRNEVVRSINSLLRHPTLAEFSESVHEALVESCCRIGPTDFLLDLYLASEEGVLPEELITQWTSSRSKAGVTGVWLDADCRNVPISTGDPFLLQHWTIFHASEISSELPLSASESEALLAFNSVASPCHDLECRLASAAKMPGIDEISLRVIRLASDDPEHFRAQHWHTAVSAAICLGSIAGKSGFAEVLARFLQLPENCLETLLGDDLTEMCEFGLALASRGAPSNIYSVVENTNAYFSSRSVALGALQLQVRLGYRTRDELATYLLGLFARKDSLAGGASFWHDVADIGAYLSVSEMLPLLRNLVQAGVFIEPDGTVYMDGQDLEELFTGSKSQIELPDPAVIDAVYLLSRCSGHESMSVAGFLSSLEPPNYFGNL